MVSKFISEKRQTRLKSAEIGKFFLVCCKLQLVTADFTVILFSIVRVLIYKLYNNCIIAYLFQLLMKLQTNFKFFVKINNI